MNIDNELSRDFDVKYLKVGLLNKKEAKDFIGEHIIEQENDLYNTSVKDYVMNIERQCDYCRNIVKDQHIYHDLKKNISKCNKCFKKFSLINNTNSNIAEEIYQQNKELFDKLGSE